MQNEKNNDPSLDNNNVSDDSNNMNSDDMKVTDESTTLTNNTDTTPVAANGDSFLTKALQQAKPEGLSSFIGLSSFKAFKDVSGAKGGNGIPSLGLVYTPRNGKRLSVSNALFEMLGQPEALAVAFTETQLALGSELPMNAQKYAFSPDKYTHTIYRSVLVQEIIRQFSLDFTEVTSKSYTDIHMESFTNATGIVVPVAIVTMK